MFKRLIIGVALTLVVGAVSGFSQDDRVVDSVDDRSAVEKKSSDDIYKNEFYGGYSYHRFRVHPRENFNGIEIAYTRNVRRFVGLKIAFAARFSTQACAECEPGYRIKVSQQSFQGGIQIKDNSKKARVRPFAHFLVGVGRQHQKFCNGSDCVQPVPDFKPFSMTVGGGLDIKINKRVDLRVIQFDYNPEFKNGFRYHNLNAGVGLVFH